jgi:hypothetical protein
VATFDLGLFRDLAFGRKHLPDHPLQDEAEAKKILALLPEGDAAYSIAELTHWTASMNATASFTPGRRGRILMLMHEASRPIWRELGQRYLAPKGVPTEGRDGDPAILRAMWDSASEFSDGFARALDTSEQESKWVKQNRAALLTRNLRWLNRRLALAYMLQGGQTAAIWERLHLLYRDSVEHDAFRTAIAAHEGGRYTTTAQFEYARPLLLELANPGGVRPREVELLYRIAARMATAVRLETEPSQEANFAVVPQADGRPAVLHGRKAATKPGDGARLYIATANCLPRLRAALERDLGRDPSEEDSLFGRGYTIRERNAMVNRALEHWGLDPPQRRTRRIGMAAAARVIAGFDLVLGVLPPPERTASEDAGSARRKLELALDATSKSLKRAKLQAARVGPARVIDASAGGLGIAIRRADARWAAHGALLAITIEPGSDWFLGVLRRIFSVEDELRLGIQILAAKPKVVTLRADTVKRDEVWADAMKHEAAFREHYQRGILLEPQALPLTGGEMLLSPGRASRGTQFGVPLPEGEQRIRVTRVVEDGEHYQRVIFESLGVGI